MRTRLNPESYSSQNEDSSTPTAQPKRAMAQTAQQKQKNVMKQKQHKVDQHASQTDDPSSPSPRPKRSMASSPQQKRKYVKKPKEQKIDQHASPLTKEDAKNININLMSSPAPISEVVKSFTAAQVQAVKDIGFGGLLHLNLKDISRALNIEMLLHYHPGAKIFKSNNLHLLITSEDIHHTLGIPISDKPVEEVSKYKKGPNPDDKIKKRWRLLLGLDTSEKEGEKEEQKKGKKAQTKATVPKKQREKTYMNNEEWKNLLAQYVDGGDEFKKVFVVFCMTTFLTANAAREVNLNMVKSLDDVSRIQGYNWCGYVLNFLCKSISDFQEFLHSRKAKGEIGDRREKKNINGCLLALVIALMHRVRVTDAQDLSTLDKPYIQHWNTTKLNDTITTYAKYLEIGIVVSNVPVKCRVEAEKSWTTELERRQTSPAKKQKHFRKEKEVETEESQEKEISECLKDSVGKSFRQVTFNLSAEHMTDEEIDALNVTDLKKKLLKLERNMMIVSESNFQLASEIVEEGHKLSHDSEEFENEEFFKLIDEAIKNFDAAKDIAKSFNKSEGPVVKRVTFNLDDNEILGVDLFDNDNFEDLNDDTILTDNESPTKQETTFTNDKTAQEEETKSIAGDGSKNEERAVTCFQDSSVKTPSIRKRKRKQVLLPKKKKPNPLPDAHHERRLVHDMIDASKHILETFKRQDRWPRFQARLP